MQWDLGEFDQKGTVATRWGTREQLLHAVEAARAHGIDVLIDAVLNVRGNPVDDDVGTHTYSISISLAQIEQRSSWLCL